MVCHTSIETPSCRWRGTTLTVTLRSAEVDGIRADCDLFESRNRGVELEVPSVILFAVPIGSDFGLTISLVAL